MQSIISKVDKHFIAERDRKALEWNSTKVKTDCEFLEYVLTNKAATTGYKKTVEEQQDRNNWWWDAKHPEYGYVDFKCKTPNKPWYNVTRRSLRTSVDHYVVWKWTHKPNIELREGDTVHMEIVAIHTKQYVMDNIKFKNNPDMGFVMVNDHE